MSTIFTQDQGLPARSLVPDILPPGAMAGPWRIERELGRGGMGAVYAVVHDGIGKRAALKVVHRSLATADQAERILLEGRVVNQVRHPNIVDIFETGTLADGRPYIVMERLDGVPLSSKVAHTKLPADQVIAILLQICDALAAAHDAGIIHRDLKLDNVVIADDGSIKVVDWGIAKDVATDLKQTLEGVTVGTPLYLSPEQARGATVTAQTDVYSLGVLAYELFLEDLPFDAPTAAEIMVMHLHAVPPPPHESWPDIPGVLEALLLAMLAKKPEARPTMTGVAAMLVAARSELEHRRGAIAAAGMPSMAIPRVTTRPRLISAGELALTHNADTIPSRRARRWPVAAGLAIAASLAVGWASRQADDHQVPASVLDAVAVRVVEPPIAVTAPAPTPVAPPVEAAAPAARPVVAPMAHRPTPKPALVHKHRDPNATVDPYR